MPSVRAGIASVCTLLGHVLAAARHTDRPPAPLPVARSLARPTAEPPASPADAVAAYARRLPEPGVALGLDGRITFITPSAARLVGADRQKLIGTLPWESLEWLHDPVYEDRYRAAVMSRRPTFFTARRPDGAWLRFELFPDDTGISVRITPRAQSGRRRHRVAAPDGEGAAMTEAPVRVGALYRLMHLAGALSEAVGTEDVVRLVADTVLPAFDAQALAMLVAEAGRLRIVGYHGYPAETMDRFDGTPLTSPTPGVRALTQGAASFFASREELDRAFPARADRWDGMSAWAFLPLTVSGRPVGTCVLGFTRPHPFPRRGAGRAGVARRAPVPGARPGPPLRHRARARAESPDGPPAAHPAGRARHGGRGPLSARHPRHGHRRRLLRSDPPRRHHRRRRHRRRPGAQRGRRRPHGPGPHRDPRPRHRRRRPPTRSWPAPTGC
ncbi:hypothetical protein GCM10020256_73970 [Streptomyces thermocoprophilus]